MGEGRSAGALQLVALRAAGRGTAREIGVDVHLELVVRRAERTLLELQHTGDVLVPRRRLIASKRLRPRSTARVSRRVADVCERAIGPPAVRTERPFGTGRREVAL